MSGWLFVVFAAFFVVAGIASLAKGRRQRDLLAGAAAELGLRYSPKGLSTDAFAEGILESFAVEIGSPARTALGGRRRRTQGLTVRIDTRGRIPKGLALEAETITARIKKVFGQKDVELDDPTFDDLVLVGGDEAGVAAIFDVATRKRTAEAVGKHGIVVKQGSLSMHSSFEEQAHLVAAVRDMADLAKQLSLEAKDVCLLLAKNARQDPSWRVRLRNLELLQTRYRNRAEAQHTSRQVLGDRNGSVRLRGALGLGASELTVVRQGLIDGSVSDELKVAALAHFIEHLAVEELPAFLTREVSGLTVELQKLAIAGAGERGERCAVPWLKSLAVSNDLEHKCAAITALGQIGDPATESLLISLIADADPGVKLAAVQGLARAGSVIAVEPLLELTQGVSGREITRAAEHAVASIQARLGDVDAGRLSVVTDRQGEGALSLTQENGALSLAEDQRGALAPVDGEKD